MLFTGETEEERDVSEQKGQGKYLEERTFFSFDFSVPSSFCAFFA